MWSPVKRGRSWAWASVIALAASCVLLVSACGFSSLAPAATPTPAPTEVPPTAAPAPPVSQTTSRVNGYQSPTGLLQLPSIAELVTAVQPAVVSIFVESVNQGLFFDFTDQGAGSGVIVRSDGYVLTNFHVIHDVVGIKVHLPDGKTYDAEAVGWGHCHRSRRSQDRGRGRPSGNRMGRFRRYKSRRLGSGCG